MNLRVTAIKGVKWTTIGIVGRAVFQLLQVAILTRFLSKEAFGLVAMALFIIEFSNIFVDMGMTSAILHRQNATKNEYSSIFWLNIFISIFLYSIIFLSAPVISDFYKESELKILIPILGINLLLMAGGRQHRTIMQKQFQFKTIAIIEIVSYFIGLIAAIILAVNHCGLYSLVYSTLLSSLISNILFLLFNLNINPIGFHFVLKETKPFLRIGGFTMGSTLLDFFSREIDILIIGKVLGAESLGIYSLAKQIVLKLYSIINPIVLNVLSPLLSSIQNEKEKLKYIYLSVIKYLAYLNFPIYLVVILSSREILSILYGSSYAESDIILSSLAVAYCLSSLSNPVGSLQIATGRTNLGFNWTIFRVLITPPIILAGTFISINAVAIFYAILSLLLIFPLWFIQLRPMANITLTEYINQFIKPLIFFITVILLILFIELNNIIVNSPIFSILIKIFSLMLSYFFFLFLFDKKIIKKFSRTFVFYCKGIKTGG